MEVAGPENLTLNQLVEAVQAATGRNGSVSHVPVLAMRVAAKLLAPIKPALAREIRAGIYLDTVDRKIEPVPTRDQYPSVPVTTLTGLLAQRNRRTRPPPSISDAAEL